MLLAAFTATELTTTLLLESTMEEDGDQQPSASKLSSQELCAALASFQVYGWKPRPDLSVDDNFLDLLVLVTRNSVCHAAGHMGCILVRPLVPVTSHTSDTEATTDTSRLLSAILAVANNMPLYNKNTSDVHAEVTAIGQCAKTGTSTDGCTAYITMPPCKNCLGALVMAGIQRIVVRGRRR